MTHPVTSIGLRPSRSDKVPATKLVAAFTNPKATMNVSATVIPVKTELFFGEQRQNRALLAQHPTHEGVDHNQQCELGQVGS